MICQSVIDVGLMDTIQSFDFSKTISLFIRENPEQLDNVCKVLEQYQRFIYIACKFNEPIPMTSKLVDRMWHSHIIADTKQYREFCFKVKGDFIDHKSSDLNEKMTSEQHSKYKSLYNSIFPGSGEEISEISICWDYP